MSRTATSMAGGSALARLVDFARREPWDLLAMVLTLHLLVWSLTPALINANLQLDLVEGLALGKEWQLVYWKHPPLPWWISAGAYALVGDVRIVYLLGPLSVVIALWAVWRLGREIVGPFPALLAVLALEGLHFFNFSAVKFSHDPAQLSAWAMTALFFHRALTKERLLDWALAGVCLALSFWIKYSAFAFAATLGLFLLVDRDARAAWRRPGPYVMAAAFLVVLAPNLWALVDSDFLPFRYADARAKTVVQWWQYAAFPLIWTVGQAFFLIPTLAILATLYLPFRSTDPPAKETPSPSAFDRRFLAWLALGPFAITTAVAIALGRLPVAMWGYPLWTMLPLTVIAWWPPALDETRLKRYAALFAAVFALMPVIYVAVEQFEPYFRDRAKATHFPGARLAEIVTREFREKTGQPLAYVAGSEFAANNVAVYSADRPRVMVHGKPELSPWIDMADVRRRGVLLIQETNGDLVIPEWAKTFPPALVRGRVSLARQTRGQVTPARIQYAILPPAVLPLATPPELAPKP